MGEVRCLLGRYTSKRIDGTLVAIPLDGWIEPSTISLSSAIRLGPLTLEMFHRYSVIAHKYGYRLPNNLRDKVVPPELLPVCVYWQNLAFKIPAGTFRLFVKTIDHMDNQYLRRSVYSIGKSLEVNHDTE